MWGVDGGRAVLPFFGRSDVNERCREMVDRPNATLVVSDVFGVTFADG